MNPIPMVRLFFTAKRRHYLAGVLLSGVLSVNAAHAALPPEHEANRLLLSVEQLVTAAQWEQATEYLDRLVALETALPPVFDYYRGRVHLELGEPAKAQQSLESYVVKAGVQGQYYKEALKMITDAETRVANQSAASAVTVDQLAKAFAIESADDYVASLQKLFLVNDPKQALLMRINSILAANTYQGTRIRQKEQTLGAEYKLAVDGGDLVIQEKIYDPKKAPEIKSTKLRVHGVDSYLRYGCDYDRYMCWVYHPVQQYDRWLLLDRVEPEAQELADALGRLIRLMQG